MSVDVVRTEEAEPTPQEQVRTGTTRRADYFITIACSGVAMLLVAIATWQGPGTSADSIVYLSAGISLAKGHGLISIGGTSLTLFPPGVPFLAALGEWSGIGAQTMLRIVSVASIGAIVALGSVILRRVVSNRAIAVGATMLLAVSQVLVGVSKMAWSEPPFVAVTLGFLLVLSGMWDRRRLRGGDIALLTVLYWLAFMFRYAGASLILLGLIVLTVALRPLDKRKVGKIIGVGMLSASVPLAWMVRNHATDGTLLGPRNPSADTVHSVASSGASTIGSWVLPITSLSTGSLAVVGVLVTILLISALVPAMAYADRHPAGSHETVVKSRTLLWCCVLFVAIYVPYLVVSALTTLISPIDSRYLSPIYVPVVVMAAAGVGALFARMSSATVRAAVGGVLVLVIAGQLIVTARDVRNDAAEGIGFNTSSSLDSALAAKVKHLVGDSPRSVIVYSNNPNALWQATGMQPIHFAPKDAGVRGRKVYGELDQFTREVECASDPTYLVVYLVTDDRYVDLSQIRSAVNVQREQSAADGAIFRVTPKSSPSCDTAPPRPLDR